ncbi:hypothetical protein CASFOL_014236 [Castilleja foliolosa]|uniref:Uncharacterized protein n=1 Tax=Castilleja foliolosa TaxID=1961234 RepID=A0ABD3DRC6_9LAMI
MIRGLRNRRVSIDYRRMQSWRSHSELTSLDDTNEQFEPLFDYIRIQPVDFVCIDADPGNDLNVYCISWIGFSRMRMKIYYFDSFKFSAGFLFNFTEAPYLVLAAVELVLWIAIKYIDPREASV